MLKPNSDRLDYGKLLAPPPGFVLEAAVGTTYSLDLDALVGACIALGVSEDTDSKLMRNPVYLLNSLRQVGGKLAIFCQAGQIHLPGNPSALYILLEQIVFEVRAQGRGRGPQYPTFHPKFWLMKYRNHSGGEVLWRVIILSRNLTFDRSWDVTAVLEGEPSQKRQKKSEPLCHFLQYLLSNIKGRDSVAKRKRNLLREMLEELPFVTFSCDGASGFEDFEFIPVGVPRNDGQPYRMEDYPLFSDSFHELLVMSPFLSDSVIEYFNHRNHNITDYACYLFTRRASLEKLHAAHCDHFNIYTLKDAVVDGESMLSEDDAPDAAGMNIAICKQDIHAKLYLWRKYNASELYLGSLNASYSALNGNIEFVVRLVGTRRKLNLNTLTKDLFCGREDDPDNPFVETPLPEVPQEEGQSEQDILERRIKDFSRAAARAEVAEGSEGYVATLRFEQLPDCTGMSIGPLLSKRSVPIAGQVVLDELRLSQLSEFYRATAQGDNCKVERVVKIPTVGFPENRENAMVNDVIKDSAAFYQYIAFLMGDDHLMAALESHNMKRSAFYTGNAATAMPALYERMLRTAATEPERFAEIDYLLRMITNEGVVPVGFAELYQTFRKVVKPRG